VIVGGIGPSFLTGDSPSEEERLKKTCQQFEGLLLGMLWKDMRDGVRGLGDVSSRPFGPLEDLSWEMAATQLAEGGGVGLWRLLYEELKTNLGGTRV